VPSLVFALLPRKLYEGKPKANAYCERFLGSVRREYLDYVLILGEKHLHRVIKEYVRYYNTARPHQGIHQLVPAPSSAEVAGQVEALPSSADIGAMVVSLSVLGGLYHDYPRAA
jgi:putative transposase